MHVHAETARTDIGERALRQGAVDRYRLSVRKHPRHAY
jgi:hypothetical protein